MAGAGLALMVTAGMETEVEQPAAEVCMTEMVPDPATPQVTVMEFVPAPAVITPPVIDQL